MNDQRIENLLNLSLDSTMEERDKSLDLNVGYNAEENTWELIVKYHGDIMRLADEVIKVRPLLGEYAIVTVPESLVDALADVEEIEYIEKPKRLFFSVSQGKRASCIYVVQEGSPYLFGEGVIVGIIDSGIDYTHSDFIDESGKTRILELWDQTLERVFTAEEINEALAQESAAERNRLVPSRDISGHGTAVAGIAAGNGRGSDGRNAGVASKSSLLVVKLGTPRPEAFPRTTELMEGIDFVVNKAIEYGRPIAVNISFGNTYGSHEGNSLLETFIDTAARVWTSVFCIGTGNEGASGGHTGGILTKQRVIELAVEPRERTLSIQLWKNYVDSFQIEIVSPTGERILIPQNRAGTLRETVEQTELLIYVGEPSPYAVSQEIYIDFLPKEEYLNSGIWQIILTPEKIVDGRYNLYLPSASVLNTGTRFIIPTPEISLTIPSTAERPISVGAYNSIYDSYADFSGRGYTAQTNQIKPDLVAPGVDITSASPGGGYGVFTGTSFATPFVTGAAALLMEWGIVRGNDTYLYGDKVKAYLRKSARQLPGESVYPNPRLGYGALCLADSLPR